MELLGLRLKALRQDRGLTQEQLANKINIVKASISGYEQHAILPSLEVFVNLCKYFNVSSDYLLGLSDVTDFHISHLTDEQISIIMNLIIQFDKCNNAFSRNKD